MATVAVTRAAKKAVPGKSASVSTVVTLTGVYVSGGETITAKQLGLRRLTSVRPFLQGSNGLEATPVVEGWTTLETGNTVCRLHLLNGKTAAELAAGVTVTGVKFELAASGY